jgi:hypothetical protein
MIRCFTLGKQIAATEIVNGEHDALKVIPADPSRDIIEGLCDGSCNQPEHRVISPRGVKVRLRLHDKPDVARI